MCGPARKQPEMQVTRSVLVCICEDLAHLLTHLVQASHKLVVCLEAGQCAEVQPWCEGEHLHIRDRPTESGCSDGSCKHLSGSPVWALWPQRTNCPCGWDSGEAPTLLASCVHHIGHTRRRHIVPMRHLCVLIPASHNHSAYQFHSPRILSKETLDAQPFTVFPRRRCPCPNACA